MSRRILLASYHFPPSHEVGGLRAGRLARLLGSHGFAVDVVCASLEKAVGSPDPSRDGAWPEEARIRRTATPFPLGHNPSVHPDPTRPWAVFRHRLRAHGAWWLRTRDWSWSWAAAACEHVAVDMTGGRYHLLVTSTPPHPAAVPFLRLARDTGVPAVCDLRDLWDPSPGSARWSPLPKARRHRWGGQIGDSILDLADHVILATEATRSLLIERRPGLSPDRLSVVTNAYQAVDPAPGAHDTGLGTTESPGGLRITYTGSLAYGRDRLMRELIEAMAALRRRGGAKAHLVVASDHPESVSAMASGCGLSDAVTALGWVDRDRATELQRQSDALLLLQPSRPPSIAAAVPGKLYDYMARRRPILALVPELGAAAELVREHRLGKTLVGRRPEAMAEELSDFLDQVVRRRVLPPPPDAFSESETVARFAQVLTRVLSARGTRS